MGEKSVGNFINCKACDKRVVKSAKVCPHCGQKLKSGIVGMLIGGFCLLIAIGIMVDDGKEGAKLSNTSSTNSNKTSTEPTAKVSKPAVPIPGQQTEFIKLITGFSSDYKKAPNELKKSALRRKRNKAIKEFLGSDLSVQWVGKVSRLSTTSQQNAHVKIELLGTGIITVSNWNNELSDMGSDTLIKAESGLYDKVSELGDGDTVKFTGSFFPDSDDHIEEQSMSESGGMTDPEFLVKFVGIEKISGS